MTWQTILKIDIREARRLGEKYAPKDMYAASPIYLDLKRRLEALPDNNREVKIARLELETYLADGDKDSLQAAKWLIKRAERMEGKK